MPVPSLRPHGPAPGTLPAGTDWDGSLPLTGPRAGSNGRSHPAEGSTVVRKTTAGLTATVVQLCAALLTAFVLARSLGPELLGQYYLLYTLTLTSALFGSLGVEAANSVFVGRGEEHPGRVHTASLLLTVLLGGTAVLLAAAAYPIPWLGLTGRVDPIHYMLALATVRSEFSWLDWAPWFVALGVPTLRPAGILSFSNYSQMIQAAIDGAGVALARLPLLERSIERGELVAPFGQRQALSRQYYLVETSRGGNARIDALRLWLLDEAARAGTVPAGSDDAA